MIRVWRTLAVACLTGFATGVAPALGAFPGDNGKVAFSSDHEGGDLDIWTIGPDGSNPVNLTAGSKTDDLLPNWRADGQEIAFMSNRVTAMNPEGDFEIFVMNADGSHQRQITVNTLDDENPAWSPDGSRIAFNRDFDPIQGQIDEDLFTMRADGTKQRNLTNSPGVQDQEPNWSPDGRRIAFVSDRDGDLEVYTTRPNGSGVRQLTFNDAFEFRPNWSPDGELIGFGTDRDGDFEVYAMRTDGTDQTNLTSNHASNEGFPAWSPNGRKIALGSDRDGDFEIYAMNADGSTQLNLTNGPAFDLAPDWQPLVDNDCRERRR